MRARYEYLIRSVHADGSIKMRVFSGTDQVDAIDNALFQDQSIKKAWIVDDTEAAEIETQDGRTKFGSWE